MKKAVFAGSFNPFTIGHADIVERGLDLFDHITICIGTNINKPEDAGNAQQRMLNIRSIYEGNDRISVECWSGLTADFAKKIGAGFLLRGIRTVKDYEYEKDMADANREIFGLETIILFTEPQYAFVSSSLVRELEAYGQDISKFLPKVKDGELPAPTN